MLHYFIGHLKILGQFLRGQEEALYEIDATDRGLKWSFASIFVATFLIGALIASPAILQGQASIFVLFNPIALLQLAFSVALVPGIFYLLSGPFDFRKVTLPLVVSYNWLSLSFILIGLVFGLVVALISIFLAVAGSETLSGTVLLLLLLGYVVFYLYRLYRLIAFVLAEKRDKAFFVFVIVLGSQFFLAFLSLSMASPPA